MKKIIYTLLALTITSCFCDNDTYYLSDEDPQLLPYESIDSASFINQNQEVIIFDSIIYERDVFEDSNPPNNFYNGNNCKDSYEIISISLTGDDGYTIYLNLESNRFITTISDENTTGSSSYYYYYTDSREELFNYTLNNTVYSNVTRLFSQYAGGTELILAPDVGIIYLKFGNNEFLLN